MNEDFSIRTDLLFDPNGILLNALETHRNIGSDHLPLVATFTIYSEDLVDSGIDESLEQKADEIVQEGKFAHKIESS